MADNQSGTDNLATEEPNLSEKYPNSFEVEDLGPGVKRVKVTVPRERIDLAIKEQFEGLKKEAQIPGFRKGHVPAKLLEKKFSGDIRNEVRRDLINETFQEAIEKNKLKVMGEPEFDDPDKINLPEDGPLTYSFQVEIAPEFDLPATDTLTVRKPVVSVTDKHVDQAMKNLREQQGSLVPIEDRGVEEGDQVYSDVHILLHGTVVNHKHGAILRAASGPVGGIQVDDLAKQLAGAKPGEKRTFKAKAPENHPTDSIRNQEVEIEVKINEIKRLEPVDIDQEFLTTLGFNSEQEIRDALKEQMQERITDDIQNAMRGQLVKHILENTKLEVPAKMVERHKNDIVRRRVYNLASRGIPRDLISQSYDKIMEGADAESARDLKRMFILQKFAEQLKVDLEEDELNYHIVRMAMQQGKRPEKLKTEMAKDGSLQGLFSVLKEEKTLDKILESVKIEEVSGDTVASALGEKEPHDHDHDHEGHDHAHEEKDADSSST